MNRTPDLSDLTADAYKLSAEYWGNRVKLHLSAGDDVSAYNLTLVAASCAHAYLKAKESK